MKTQYQNTIGLIPATPIGINNLQNMVALQGLNLRDHARFLQNVVTEFFPHTYGLKALDLAGGSGVSAVTLAEMGFEVAAYDLYRNSISVVQKIALEQKMNISFAMGGILRLEQVAQQFDLIHDCECLTNTPMPEDRMRLLQAMHDSLAVNGRIILKTTVLTETYDPEDSFESVHLDPNFILWRQTPHCDVAGVVDKNGKSWTAQKRIAPAQMIRQELIAAGFVILHEEIDCPANNAPASMKVVLASGLNR